MPAMPSTVVGTRAWLVAIVAVALVVRLGVVAATPGYVPHHDDRDYDRVAWSMASGHGYPPVRIGRRRYADAYRPPLWPAALGLVYAAVGHRVTAGRVADAALRAAGGGLLARGAWRLLGPADARRAGWLAAGYLPLALMSSVLISETLLVACELLALRLALEARRRRPGRPAAAAAGAAAGLAALTRANGAVVLVAVVGLCGRRRAVAAIAACALVLAPWAVRNAVELHAFVPVSTEAGPTLAGTYNRASMTARFAP